MKNGFLLYLSLILSIKCCVDALQCYKCTEATPGCGPILTNTTLEKVACDFDDASKPVACVVFRNKYDNFRYTRGCSKELWVPPLGSYDEKNKNDCIRDKFSLEIFCFCSTDLCNANNTANETIFINNECNPNPCLNSGECIDKYARYECQCNGNFEGQRCEKCKPGYSGADCKTEPPEDPCVDTTICKNGGTCEPTEPKKYKCTCKDNFIGINCEIDASKFCNPNPCLNGANCVIDKETEKYKCENCPTGFNGTNCQTNIDECKSSPCKNNATCLDQVNGFFCVCPYGKKGTLCDEDINECLSSPCNVNGILETNGCTDLDNGFRCNCKPGFKGILCEVDINECESNPCKNGGTCKDLPGGYKCDCDTVNFTGKKCEVPIYHCSADVPDACNDHGDCSGGVGTQPIVCACFEGYTGTKCETKISICNTQKPCLNGGTCKEANNPAGYSCTCNSPLYTGNNCEIKNSPCLTTKLECKNGGVCVDLDNGQASCNCTIGYSGTNCETNYFSCTAQGTFEDIKHCARYINCYDQGDGKLIAESITCPKISSTQLLYHPFQKSCVLPSKHPNPTCTQ